MSQVETTQVIFNLSKGPYPSYLVLQFGNTHLEFSSGVTKLFPEFEFELMLPQMPGLVKTISITDDITQPLGHKSDTKHMYN